MFLYVASAVFVGWLLFRLFEPRRVRAVERPSPEQLQQLVEEQPNVENRLALAEALEQRGDYKRARELYEKVLKVSQADREALHGIARCELSLDQPARAVEHLEELLEIDREYGDYSAALNYAEALSQAGRSRDAAELMQGLTHVTGRINHRVALAHYLMLDGDRDQARQVLDAILAGDALSDTTAKRWRERAKRMRTELG